MRDRGHFGRDPRELWARSWYIPAMDEFRAVFEAAPDGILVVDEEGTIVSANARATELFGWGVGELLGKPVELLVPEHAAGVHHRHRARYMRSPQARPMGIGLELRAVRRNGEQFPVEISLSPWESEQGRRIIATVRDVTDQKRLRDFGAGALRASEDERLRISRELHDDTAQRLAALLLRVRLIERDLDDERLQGLCAALRTDISECAEGVRRLARGLRPPELADAGLVAALQAHVRGLEGSTDGELELDADFVEERLDEESKLVLYRVIQEAVMNAIRHSGSGVIRIRVYQESDQVVGEVRDDGRGFVPGEEASAGAGLGVMGMRERAAMVRGRVRIESEEGEGTTVRVELPCTEEAT